MIDITESQRQAKSRFWQKFEKNPLLGNAEALSGPQICQLAGNVNTYRWLQEREELWNWFFDKDYAASVLNSGLEIAVRTLIQICNSPISREVPATAQVKAAETLMKFGGMGVDKRETSKSKDSQIDNMDVAELEAFVAAGGKALKVAPRAKKTS